MIRSVSGKRSLSKRWEEHAKAIHYSKLKNMRPTLDLSCPTDFSHLRSKAKKDQQREEIVKRLDEIRIVMYDPKISESYSLEIGFNEALEIMGEKEDYEALVAMMKVENDEIMLVASKDNDINN